MEKWIYKNELCGNTGIIEEVMILPYKDAKKREKGYRVIAVSEYDQFVYHVSVFETLQAAKDDLKSICFDVQ